MIKIIIPIICLEIQSDCLRPLILYNHVEIDYFDKITLYNIKFYGNLKFIKLIVPRVIFMNV